ncbi:hypothetical protein [Oryza sativa Japonica Group]|uniref:Uncharacterized protein n=1 Tax=Oryza sativa subsp. japonica TaxID=39947 RepID=Q5VQK8_ORYSJ|nr:hypothetical protein [Oryza sativa Japonica Group]
MGSKRMAWPARSRRDVGRREDGVDSEVEAQLLLPIAIAFPPPTRRCRLSADEWASSSLLASQRLCCPTPLHRCRYRLSHIRRLSPCRPSPVTRIAFSHRACTGKR